MEIKNLLAEEKIIGVISNYEVTLKRDGIVSDLKVKNISKALKMVGLDDTFIDKRIIDLTISELWKIDLMTKLEKDIIIVGNIYDSLIYKDREYIKKLLIKLSREYNKKIIVVDNYVNTFFGLTNKLYVIKSKEIIYKTDSFFDNGLYNYVSKPKIIDFIDYVNKESERLQQSIDIYELIKDIYRSVS